MHSVHCNNFLLRHYEEEYYELILNNIKTAKSQVEGKVFLNKKILYLHTLACLKGQKEITKKVMKGRV